MFQPQQPRIRAVLQPGDISHLRARRHGPRCPRQHITWRDGYEPSIVPRRDSTDPRSATWRAGRNGTSSPPDFRRHLRAPASTSTPQGTAPALRTP